MNNNNITIEVCAFNLQSCINAQLGGAGRIELCANPTEGGTTPSAGFLQQARKLVSIDLYPIIRPRGGHYLYSEDELECMRQDVLFCKQIGCEGISIGIQKIDGSLDVAACKQFIEWAYPMKVSLNKAFDLSPNLSQSLQDAIDAGFERILTSGGKTTIEDGLPIVVDLMEQAKNNIAIMPGCGLRSYNIGKVATATKALHYHSAARLAVANPLQYQNNAVLDLGTVFNADVTEIKALVKIANEQLPR
jgi:copper homeostasis protein